MCAISLRRVHDCAATCALCWYLLLRCMVALCLLLVEPRHLLCWAMIFVTEIWYVRHWALMCALSGFGMCIVELWQVHCWALTCALSCCIVQWCAMCVVHCCAVACVVEMRGWAPPSAWLSCDVCVIEHEICCCCGVSVVVTLLSCVICCLSVAWTSLCCWMCVAVLLHVHCWVPTWIAELWHFCVMSATLLICGAYVALCPLLCCIILFALLGCSACLLSSFCGRVAMLMMVLYFGGLFNADSALLWC